MCGYFSIEELQEGLQMKQICKENLEGTICNLESLIQEHEKAYEEHPMFLGIDKEDYNHKERAEDYKKLLGYLKELEEFRQRKNS